MPLGVSNYNSKIWIFIYSDFDYSIFKDIEQQLTINLKQHNHNQSFFITLVYVKCNALKRQIL